ncbi:MAG: beta-xylosidase [Acidobacteriaceae bacterium]|jgi:xylan 1,4-beta-xylosidase
MRKLAITLLCLAAIPALPQASAPGPSTPPAPPAQVSIQVDLARSLGPYQPISRWFGYDEINFTTGKYGSQLLPELHDLSPVPVYIRAHHLLTSGDGQPKLKWSSTNVFSLDGAGKPVYNFTILDQIFDEYQRAGVRPMVELGFMPKDLASGTMQYEFPYPNTIKGSVQSPPKDYAMWGELVRTVVAHFVQRYGRDQVATWYFEVWNEPDISYWQGTPEQYFKLYDYSVAGVRAALPEARVGGPGSTGPGSQRAITFLTNFLNHCASDKSAATGGPIPLDFISFHPKGSPRLVPPGPGETAHIRMGLQNEISAAANGFRTVAASAKYHNLPIILSEADPEGCAACSARENPNNAYRNSPVYPTYTAAAMKALLDLAAENKVNLIGMVTWAFEFEGKQYFEGFRTLATNGIDQPVLNIFRMAGLFSGDRVAATSSSEVPAEDIAKSGVRAQPDVDAFATKSTHEAAVMLWNYHDEDLPVPASQVTVKITGIPAGIHKVLLEHFRIDDTHSNAYTVWVAMGSPQSPTPEQYTQLQAAGQLQTLTSPTWLDVTSNSVTIPTTLPREATSLLHLSW